MKFGTALLFGAAILAAPSVLPAQPKSRRSVPAAQLRAKGREVFEGHYIVIPKERQRTSPAFRFSSPRFFTTQVNVLGGANILGDAANEPSIAVDPTDHNRMAIGWRQFNTVTDNFRQAGYGYTTDGGASWTFPGVLDSGVFRSDPVLSADAEGNFYYNSLTTKRSDFSCDVYRSASGGAAWDTGTYAYGGDKQWMAAGNKSGDGPGNLYAFWTPYYSACPPGSFTRSADQGFDFEPCTEIPGSPFWGTLAAARDGTLYFGARGDTSFIAGKSSSARDSGAAVTWDAVTPVDLGGDIAYGTDPNPEGLAGQVWVAVDTSGGPTDGNVYLLCSVQPRSGSDPLDVMFSRSTDGGLGWSPPVRVNDDADTTAWQWFGTMSVAPDGRIDVVWLDTRDNPGTVLSSLYYAYSTDGGTTWSPNERLSGSFDPHVGWPQQNKMGDYFHMVSDNAGAHLAWAATFNGEEDVYYGHINQSFQAGAATVSLRKGWNLLSLPLLTVNGAKSVLFPTAISDAFWYEGGGYATKESLAAGNGYWLKFAGPDSATLSGTAVVSETVSVRAGWNMIGAPGAELSASAITSDPPGIVTSEFFAYDGAYATAQILRPGLGYWVLADQPGSLMLSSLAAASSRASIRIVPTSAVPPPAPDGGAAGGALPSAFALEQNYPEPFNPATSIRFALAGPGRVTLSVFDMLGREVATLLAAQQLDAGNHSVTFQAGNLPSGVYFYRVRAVGARGEISTAVRKMVLLR